MVKTHPEIIIILINLNLLFLQGLLDVIEFIFMLKMHIETMFFLIQHNLPQTILLCKQNMILIIVNMG